MGGAKRMRRGRQYTPAVSLYELTELTLDVSERRRLQQELCARTGRFTHFDPHVFVVVQEQSLKAWAAILQKLPQTPGGWARAIRT